MPLNGMDIEKDSVYDQDDRQYFLASELAAGGQGIVYRTQGSTDLVKLFKSSRNASDEIARVRRMPLSGLPVARPMSLINEPGGYTLKFQTDMDVVRSLKYNHRNHVRDWWFDTGGLGRRLWLGARIASIFERLHSRGLVYGDVSANNIMVSKSNEFTEVSLIDLDNLSYFGERTSAEVWTPTYSAPEVAENFSPPSFESDDFSLAVILFELITMIHPFMDGDSVKGTPTDSEIYELARRCLVPSVIDSGGENNCSTYPVHNEKQLLGDDLLKLFNVTFDSKSFAIEDRITAGRFRVGLAQGALSTIECGKCDWAYSSKIFPACPDCDHVEQGVSLRILSPDGIVRAYEVALGSKKRTVDLGVLFPALLEQEVIRGSYTIDLVIMNRKVRISPRNPNLVDVPRNIEGTVNAAIKNFGVIKIEVVTR